jgi:hypothetical protein
MLSNQVDSHSEVTESAFCTSFSQRVYIDRRVPEPASGL